MLLEKELNIEIQKELSTELAIRNNIDKIKEETRMHSNSKKQNVQINNTSGSSVKSNNSPPGLGKRKSINVTKSNQPSSSTSGNIKTDSPAKKHKRIPNKMVGLSKRKTKLYCICQKPYDDSK